MSVTVREFFICKLLTLYGKLLTDAVQSPSYIFTHGPKSIALSNTFLDFFLLINDKLARKLCPKVVRPFCHFVTSVCAVVSINDRDVDFLLVPRADDRLGRGGRRGGRQGRVGLAQPGWQLPLRTD